MNKMGALEDRGTVLLSDRAQQKNRPCCPYTSFKA